MACVEEGGKGGEGDRKLEEKQERTVRREGKKDRRCRAREEKKNGTFDSWWGDLLPKLGPYYSLRLSFADERKAPVFE